MPFTIDGHWVCSKKSELLPKIGKVWCEKRKGRFLTIISVSEKEFRRDLCKKLKTECHCGGAEKGDRIELQGDHLEKVKVILKREKAL